LPPRPGGFLYVLHFAVPLVASVALGRRGQLGSAAFRTPAPGLALPLAFAACAVLIVASAADSAAGGRGWPRSAPSRTSSRRAAGVR